MNLKTKFMENKVDTESYLPEIFRINDKESKEKLAKLADGEQGITIIDDIVSQLKELIKSLHPSIKIKPEEYDHYIKEHLNGTNIDEYGVWVYYPWSKKLIHLLDEEEFVEVRTNRNRYKITRDEQAILHKKKIGIIGLSVGQSIALTIAMERTCGELRLADFDTAELSNLNRIRTGVQNLGLKKTIIAAREIAEIDPFINIEIFSEGITKENMDAFFVGENGKLDMLVEVCDGLDIKIVSRFKARELGIPVVMDTNDRGMLDIERFDLEPDREILHGLAKGLDPQKIHDLTNEEKIPYILKMVGSDKLSTRLKASMMEVEQSINTWPQLASSVVLGGALTTDVIRRIFLDQLHVSGRYYVDLDEIVCDGKDTLSKVVTESNPYKKLDKIQMDSIVADYFETYNNPNFSPQSTEVEKIIDAAIAAPSAGNNQPWKIVYQNGIIFLFHDKIRSWSWGDYYEMGSHMALGTCIENMHLEAMKNGLEDDIQLFPLNNQPFLIAAIQFKERKNSISDLDSMLANYIFSRHTNRKLGQRVPLEENFFEDVNAISGAFGVKLYHTENAVDLAELGDIIATCDKIRLLHQQGHEEFYSEVRWDDNHAKETRDGIDIHAVDITIGEIAAFKMAANWDAVSLLSKWDKGNAFKKLSIKSLNAASSIMIFTIPRFDHSNLVEVGRIVERVWLLADRYDISVHPMLSFAFFFNRLIHGKEEGLNKSSIDELKLLRKRFLKIFPLTEGEHEVFVMKLAKAEDIGVRAYRFDKNEIFHTN